MENNEFFKNYRLFVIFRLHDMESQPYFKMSTPW